ncbi:RDD family protein [Hymenobacter caeli]|uniref:RDD family membrane protein YckC n=1 Tax=Hymenobacter caeli TaxID=2735894 RepID=A0ABX2FPK3_9BACT|nr:RDD family protein [Hymenobacter caeli]NRT19110.1 putative RDD family membrane protein YckC [Hymenobacter caeli]
MAIIRVHTTQNVTLEYETASLGERILAALIDYAIIFAWFGVWVGLGAWAVSSAGPTKNTGSKDETAGIILLVIIALPYVFYHLVCEVFFNGQSLGKKARHIRVMRLDGTAPRFGDYLMRWLLRIFDSGMIAVIAVAASSRGQRLGDMAAGTTVVSVRPRPAQATPLAADLAEVARYRVVFPQAAQLADHDVALVRQLVYQAQARGNYELLHETANKVKALTHIETDLPDLPFLQTVLRDHAHLAAQE